MAYVILPSRRKRPDNFELDYSHPLAQGLVFADVGGLPVHEDRSLLRSNALGTPGLAYSHDIGRRVFSGFGSTQYVSLPQNIVLLPLSDFTASILFKTDAVKSANCVMAWGGTDDILVYGPESAPTVRVFWRDIGGNIGTTAIPSLGAWVHVCLASRGDADHRVYINGVNTLSSTASKSAAGPFTTARIGQWADSTSQNFSGYIADPIFYNRALSQEEIAILANKTDPMLAGMIRDKKPAPRHWFMPIPDDCKVKTVTPVRSSGNSPFSVGIQLPKDKDRPNVFKLDYNHQLGKGLVFAHCGDDGIDYSPFSNHAKNSIRKSRPSDVLGRKMYDGSLGDGYEFTAIPAYNFGTGAGFSISFFAAFFENAYAESGSIFNAGWTSGWSVIFDRNTGPYNYRRVGYYSPSSASVTHTVDAYQPFGKFTHYCFVIKFGVGVFVYLNGILNNTKEDTTVTPAFYTALPWVFAGNSPNNKPLLADAFLHNRILSQEEISLLANKSDPMLDGLIRPSKPRTVYSFASKHNIVGTQDANNLNWTWGNK